MRRRVGRPGLVGTMARTAVVAGTASAVVGGMSKSRNANAAAEQAQQQASMDSQAQVADMQAQLNAMQIEEAKEKAVAEALAAQAAQAESPAAEASGGDDMASKLQQLADLNASGVLSDDEFAAAKAKLLA